MNKFLVGGAVRDSLLGLPVSDKDWVVVGSTPCSMLELGFTQVGASFPVFLHPDSKEEHALARKEKKSGSGYTGFECEFGVEVTLEEDLCRRDLTINSMAMNEDGSIIDPYDGLGDLKKCILRHVSDSFSEDPLRVLRVARFAARFFDEGFTIAPATMTLMKDIVSSGELETLPAERIVKEINKAFSESNPSVFFTALRDCGALKVLLPEIDVLFGIPQRVEFHPEVCTGIHTLMVVDQARKLFNDLDVCWMALLHDVGKGVTPVELLPKHLMHEENGMPIVRAICKRLGLSKDISELSVLMCELHLRCHRLPDMRPKKIHALILKLDGIRRPDRVKKFAHACESDAKGRLGLENNEYPQRAMLINCAGVASNISAKRFVEKGIKGLALGEAMRIEQIQAIRNFLKQGVKY